MSFIRLKYTFSSHFCLKSYTFSNRTGASGCFMYFHFLTKDVVSIRPDEYDEPVVVAVAAAEVEEKDIANGLPKVTVADMPSEVDRLINELKRTPLLIDTSESQVVRTFYTYKAMLEDVSCLTVPFGKSGIKKEEVMERCRAKVHLWLYS